MSLDIWINAVVDTGGAEPHKAELFSANITHNVAPMWRKAGVMEALYESDGKLAGEVLEVLRAGLADMKAKPAEYKALNPSNGWGSYARAVPWLENFIEACAAHPKGVIRIWA